MVDNMYNAASKVGSGKEFQSRPCLVIHDHVWFSKCVIDLVAATALQVWRLPAVKVVVIRAVAAITDGRAVSVFAVDVVIAALG